MSEEKVVSRRDIYDSEPEEGSSGDDQNYGGFSDFDIDIDDDQLEVAETKEIRGASEDEEKDDIEVDEENEEVELQDRKKDAVSSNEPSKSATSFRLFSTSSAVLVNLEEEDEDEGYVKQERPESYYFAQYTDAERLQFISAAVSGVEIVNRSNEPQRCFGIPRGKLVDLKEYNNKIMKQYKLREFSKKAKAVKDSETKGDKEGRTDDVVVITSSVTKIKRRRPGKKTRLARIEMKQRKIDLANEAKKIKLRVAQREKQSKKSKGIVTPNGIIKKKTTRRGGKKNNKKPTGAGATTGVAASGPVFRTE